MNNFLKIFLIRYIPPIILFFLLINIQSGGIPSRSLNVSRAAPITDGGSKWICPNDHLLISIPSVPDSQDLNYLFSNEDQWKNVLSKINVFQFYLGSLFDNLHTEKHDFVQVSTNETIQKAVQVLKKYNIDIAVEGGALFGFDDCGALEGEKAAQTELTFIKRIYDAGGSVSYLSMDDPIDRLHNSTRKMLNTICNFDLNTVIREIVDYMKAIHAERPEIKIGIIFNFPARIYNGVPAYPLFIYNDIDYKIVLDGLIKAVDRAGEKLYFVHADNPFDMATGIAFTDVWCSITTSDATHYPSQTDWIKRILDLEQQTESYGLAFGLIYNSQRGGGHSCDSSSDKLFYDDVMTYLDLYKERGGSPQNYVIQSWYKRPYVLAPETQPYSFMYLINNVFQSDTTTALTSSSSNQVLRVSSDTKVYEIVNNLIHWIPNPTVFNAYGFNWSNIKVVSNDEVSKYSSAKLLKAQGDTKVYYLTETGQIRHVPNPEIFNSYNNKWEEILTVSQAEINSYPVSNLIRLEGGEKVYKLENGQKRWIETAEAFNKLKYDWTKIAPVNQTELNYYSEGAVIE